MKHILFVCCLVGTIHFQGLAQETVDYGYPVHYISLHTEGKDMKMAYMDVGARSPNGQVVLLLHGKNFSGFYWRNVISFLNEAGYRVIVPDQVGWGKSDKPDIHYSFPLLACQTKQLLDFLKLDKVVVLGHSMGGMLATRFVLMYPQTAEKMILENPIGLEDYKTFVPYTPTDTLYKKELSATYQSYHKYQESYYPEWKPEYEPPVAAQAAVLKEPGFKKIAWANALTYQMIYEQPVCYEFGNIKMPVLLVIGQADRTIVGKDKLNELQKQQHGRYIELGERTAQAIRGSKLVPLSGVGHIPHIQSPETFKKAVLDFLK